MSLLKILNKKLAQKYKVTNCEKPCILILTEILILFQNYSFIKMLHNNLSQKYVEISFGKPSKLFYLQQS